MNSHNIKNQKGFTIVELLIVIVVIGILAAITIVAFNGVQDRGNTTRAQSVASDVQKKAEAFNAENSRYPLSTEFSGIAALSQGNNVATAAPTGDARKTTAVYTACPSGATTSTITGARIQFWDFTTKALTPMPASGTETKTITVGTC